MVAFVRPVSPLLLAGALVALVLAYIAASRPMIAAPVALGVIAFVPVYWGRGLGGFGVALIPVTLAAIVLLPAAARRLSDVRLVPLDVLVGIFVVVRCASFLLNYPTGPGAATGFATRLLAAYVPFRVLAVLPGMRRRLAVVMIGTGGLLAAISRFESRGANWFFGALPPGFQAGSWARPELRFRTVRVEAGFGHPIAFGLFLAVVIVLALAVAVTSRHRRAPALIAAIGGLSLLALVDTLSRGPLLVAIGGVVLWGLLERRQVTGPRIVTAAVVVAALAVFTPTLIAIGALWASSTGDTREARSAEYRLQIAAVLADPSEFSLLGRATDVEGDVGQSVARRVGFKSLDNEYVIVYAGGGALTLLAFVLIALAVLRVVLLPRLDPVDRAWAVAVFAVALGLVTVALLTQFADLFWISIGLCAAIAQTSRDARPPGMAASPGAVRPFREEPHAAPARPPRGDRARARVDGGDHDPVLGTRAR